MAKLLNKMSKKLLPKLAWDKISDDGHGLHDCDGMRRQKVCGFHEAPYRELLRVQAEIRN